MLELWGGVECTVNRVGNHYLDQLAMSGHDQRLGDLERFSELGIKTLRFPVLWEHLAPKSLNRIDWTWADQRLNEVRRLGIRVIVGFEHHGSGPQYTSLLDPEFAPKLAQLAGAFAARYPWVDAYTPINEPLTTARFSGLYGCWYPHARDNKSFLRMLFHECDGIRAAMMAIRAVNPKAELIQTEDLGKVFSTSFLAYQANFENHRRWLSFDLLIGKVNLDHPLYRFCLKHGLTGTELESFAENPCPPDILGINHYITSNRFLDERIERYPAHVHGGNNHHRYADIEAVRVGAEMIVGPKELLKEAWDRYGLPVAITEVHLGCSREEQMRWFRDIWLAAKASGASGIDVRAVTSWSLLGGFDWNSLVTKANGYYEPGVYDLRSPEPRPTALASMVKAYSVDSDFDHPALDNQGWWHRADRLLYPSVNLDAAMPRDATSAKESNSYNSKSRSRDILITGGASSLSSALAYICERRGLSYRLVSQADLDLTDAAATRFFLNEMRPWAILNAFEFADVESAEEEDEDCFRTNILAPIHLAEYCTDERARLVQFSSDQVFDGRTKRPYREQDAVSPINIYGRSKAKAEEEIASRASDSLIIRTPATFGPWDETNFLTRALRSIAKGKPFHAPNDLISSPTYLPDLVDAALDLLIDGEHGIWHLSNQSLTDWASFGRLAAAKFGLSPSLIIGRPLVECGFAAPRPKFTALGSERAHLLPELARSVDCYIRECRVALR
ncbi:MAG: SDR family oxidoreductase [Chitinophagaceae bacterium]|nr:SDR family oxidoreductase [Oligoflexus sp.]